MIIYKNDGLHIYFGNKSESFERDEFNAIGNSKKLLQEAPFLQVQKGLKLEDLVVLRQIHSTIGFKASKTHEFAPYLHEGDYLLTNVPFVGLGVVTADCLPIIYFDPEKQVIAAAHAGWQGSVAGIAGKVVGEMGKIYGCKPEDIEVYFGPAAGVCCYEIQEDFLTNLEKEEIEKCIDKREKLYFNLSRYNTLQLIKAGIKSNAINKEYNACTICDTSFCSYRRDKNMRRQMTIVSLT